MAERKSRGRKPAAKPARAKAKVIDVEASERVADRPGSDERDGEPEERDEPEDSEHDGEPDADHEPQESDAEQASSSPAIEPDEVLEDDEEAQRAERGSSLAKRDPMALYLRETRRYPLLTPEEER